MPQRNCVECGKSYWARGYRDDKCSVECKRAFNNRRQLRGAMLYDLVMAQQFSSDERVKQLGDRIKPLLDKWNSEDKAAGRKRSWKAVSEIMYDRRTYAPDPSS